MRTARFDVAQPASVEEAVECLADHGGDAVVVAGGTDLLREIRSGVKRPKLLVSLDRIDSLAGIREAAEGSLIFGPATTMAEISGSDLVRRRLTALSEGASWMGSPQVRNLATFGGNICNARPCADTAPPSFVCDAVLSLRGPEGSRTVDAGEFMTGPGKTVRTADEVLETIRFPPLPDHTGSAFLTVTNRKAMEITITSAAARVTLESPEGAIVEAKICLGSVAPVPVRAGRAEAELVGKEPTGEVLAAAARAAVSDCTPIDDLRGSAEYRRWMVETLVRRALEAAVGRARGDAPRGGAL